MKIFSRLPAFIIVTAFFGFAGAAAGGTLTVTSGPTFTPSDAFTNNTLQVQTLHNPPGVTGDVVKGTGGTTITPGSATSASIAISHKPASG